MLNYTWEALTSEAVEKFIIDKLLKSKKEKKKIEYCDSQLQIILPPIVRVHSNNFQTFSQLY